MSGQDAIAAAWDRIETWLREHAPRTLGTLNGPVGEHEIREAEQVLGVCLPPGLVTSLRRHDGACGESADGEVDPAAFCLPSEHRLLPLSEIVARTLMLRSVEGGGGDGEWWHAGYLQVASYDVTTDGTVLDCREGETYGRVGGFSRMSGTSFTGPADFGALLEATAVALEEGRGVLIDLDEEEVDEDDPNAAPLRERAVIWD
ncbi:hypothetical protein ACIO87_21410 [Streptomyces sp. NPDC087218]|uniref:hypothetical protein n=1 Tax=Streptomyces sp. NPDC087218 TaxID=3365769 RepID=UPI0038304B8B